MTSLDDQGGGARLWAALALLFDERDAARLAAGFTASEAPASLGRVCRLAARHYTLLRLRGLLRPAPGEGPPLAPRRSLGARASLALALQLGLTLDAGTLARLFACSEEEIAADLDQARRMVDPTCPVPCGRAPTLARYREPLDPAAQLALYAHLRTCLECQTALEGYERVDRSLLAAVAARAERLPPRVPAAPAWRLRALWLGTLAGALVLLLGLVLAVVAAAHDLSAARARPAPLLAHVAAVPGSAGWLLELDDNHQFVVRDLATGRTMLAASSGALGELDTPFVAPDGVGVAVWTRPNASTFPISESAVSPGWLTLSSLDGTVRWRDAFDSTSTFTSAAGWMGNRFLLVEMPRAIGSDTLDTQSPQLAPYRLVAIDGASGNQQTIFQGDFAQAQPSPDGGLVALTGSADLHTGARTLELRPVDGDQLGAPLLRLDQVTSDVIWAPDSSRLIVSLLPGNGAASGALAVIDRSGGMRSLALPGGAPLTPVTLTPGGGSLIALAGPEGGNQPTRSLLRVPLDGGQPVRLLDAPVLGVTAALTSPDRRSLLLAVARGSYLAPNPASGTTTTELLRLGLGAELHALGGQLGEAAPLAWLPPGALPAAASGSVAQGTAPEPVSQLGARQLAGDDSLDPTGRWLVLLDRSQPILWNRATNQSQSLPPALADTSWLPDGSGLIGVLPTAPGAQPANRLALYTPRPNVALDQSTVTQVFDPAGLGSRTDLRYARPLVAPDSGHLAFFVIDQTRQRVALWLAGWDAPAHAVDEWSWPAHQDAAIPLAARWVDGSTLLVVQAGDWRGGLPQQTTLFRYTFEAVGAGGTIERTPLLTLHSLGGDRGIDLSELTLSPNGASLAYRLRHFTRIGPGPLDTITLAPGSDLGKGIELARGDSGEGLAWSPDSARLAAGLDGGIRLFSASGAASAVPLPNGARAADPVWLGGQLWFNLDGATGAGVWRVSISSAP